MGKEGRIRNPVQGVDGEKALFKIAFECKPLPGGIHKGGAGKDEKQGDSDVSHGAVGKLDEEEGLRLDLVFDPACIIVEDHNHEHGQNTDKVEGKDSSVFHK